jgi:hypothetical protein
MRNLVCAHDPAQSVIVRTMIATGRTHFAMVSIRRLRARRASSASTGCAPDAAGAVFGDAHAGSPIASRSASEARRAWAA